MPHASNVIATPSLFHVHWVSTWVAVLACSRPIQNACPEKIVITAHVWSLVLLSGASLPPQVVQAVAAANWFVIGPALTHFTQQPPLQAIAVAVPTHGRPVGLHVTGFGGCASTIASIMLGAASGASMSASSIAGGASRRAGAPCSKPQAVTITSQQWLRRTHHY